MIINSNYIFFPFTIFSSLLFFFAFKAWAEKRSKHIKEIQTIHDGEVLRIGGVMFFIYFLTASFFSSLDDVKHIFRLVLMSSLPFFVLALREDLYRNVHHIHRFWCILFGSVAFLISYDFSWPRIDFPGFDFLYSHPLLIYCFYILAISTIVNGSNFIDGMNGLSTFVSFFSFCTLYFLSFQLEDKTFIVISSASAIISSIFLLFNFPRAKFFLGDSGAYLLGFLNVCFYIIFLGKHPELSNWIAPIALFYLIFEPIFSVFRKVLMKKSPFLPDEYHLHLLIYKFLIRKFPSKISNPLTGLLLSFFGLLGFIFIVFFPKTKVAMGFSFCFLSLIYFLIYFYFYRRLYLNKQ